MSGIRLTLAASLIVFALGMSAASAGNFDRGGSAFDRKTGGAADEKSPAAHPSSFDREKGKAHVKAKGAGRPGAAQPATDGKAPAAESSDAQ